MNISKIFRLLEQFKKINMSKFLEGPVSMHEFTGHNKVILLIGDLHELETTCPKGTGAGAGVIQIEKYIDEIIRNNPNLEFDIFFEEGFPQTRSVRVDIYLTRVIRHFQLCLQSKKQSCKYSNARFHYVDVRKLGMSPQDIIGFEIMIEFIHTITDVVNEHKTDSEIYKAIKPHLAQWSTLLLNNFEYLFLWNEENIEKKLKAAKIEKQLASISVEDKKIIDVIKNVIPFTRLDEKDVMQTIRDMEILNNEDTFSRDILFVQLFGVIWEAFDNFSKLMDWYVMGRVFKSYPRNIIIYAGEAHIENYHKVLENLDFKEVFHYVEESKKARQCINLEEYPEGLHPWEKYNKPEVEFHHPIITLQDMKKPCNQLQFLYNYQDWNEFARANSLVDKITSNVGNLEACEMLKREYRKKYKSRA
jgi:hypothetical protein